MMGRGLESRIIKLEARRNRTNEVLVIWRRPDADVRAAVAGATFAPGDRVICVEWFGDGPVPAPQWRGDRLGWGRESIEGGYIYKSLSRQLDRLRDPGFADLPAITADRAEQLPDLELLHMVFGVKT
jgi:hypothetical protein